MTIIGYWQPLARPDTLMYILAYKDAAARDAAWAAFSADPSNALSWQAAATTASTVLLNRWQASVTRYVSWSEI